MREKVKKSDGVLLLKSLSLEIGEAACVIETDACPDGMAFWYPAFRKGFAAAMPQGTPATQIIFYKALAVLSALMDTHSIFPSQSKIVVFTDNLTTVAMFNSLSALPEYNHILKEAVDILLEGGHDLRVLHIAGKLNLVVDAHSRFKFMKALSVQPGLTIHNFEPFWHLDCQQLPPLLLPPQVALRDNMC